MKQLLIIAILFLILLNAKSQDCTAALAESQPTILEKDVDSKFFSLKDAMGKSLGEALYQSFEAVLKATTGLHGSFHIANVSDNPLKGLISYTATAAMFNVYCKRGGGMGWKGLYNLKFYCLANDLSYFAQPVDNDKIRMSESHFIFVDNQIVYRLKPRELSSTLKGYPYLSNAFSGNEEVLITKQGQPIFLPITRRDYLVLMRKSAEAQLVVLKKNLADYIKDRIPADTKTWEEHLKCCMSIDEKGWMKSWTDFLPEHPEAQIKFDKEMAVKKLRWEKEKTAIEDWAVINIGYYEKDIKEVDALLTVKDIEYLNKPCITSHSLETLGGKTFKEEKDYFFDEYGIGNAWAIINPAYLNKKLPASVPQFFTVGWREGITNAEKRAVLTFRQNFDFNKLKQMLEKGLPGNSSIRKDN